jgi:hypothetical protein
LLRTSLAALADVAAVTQKAKNAHAAVNQQLFDVRLALAETDNMAAAVSCKLAARACKGDSSGDIDMTLSFSTPGLRQLNPDRWLLVMELPGSQLNMQRTQTFPLPRDWTPPRVLRCTATVDVDWMTSVSLVVRVFLAYLPLSPGATPPLFHLASHVFSVLDFSDIDSGSARAAPPLSPSQFLTAAVHRFNTWHIPAPTNRPVSTDELLKITVALRMPAATRHPDDVLKCLLPQCSPPSPVHLFLPGSTNPVTVQVRLAAPGALVTLTSGRHNAGALFLTRAALVARIASLGLQPVSTHASPELLVQIEALRAAAPRAAHEFAHQWLAWRQNPTSPQPAPVDSYFDSLVALNTRGARP